VVSVSGAPKRARDAGLALGMFLFNAAAHCENVIAKFAASMMGQLLQEPYRANSGGKPLEPLKTRER
jgi:hypothetical protein